MQRLDHIENRILGALMVIHLDVLRMKKIIDEKLEVTG
jgi:hypothetical protein